MKLRSNVVGVLMLLFCAVPSSLGENACPVSGRAVIEGRVAGEFRRPHPIALRREDLEQALVELQLQNKYGGLKPGNQMRVEPIEIYQVLPSGLHVVNGVIDSVSVSLDDVPTWVSAYSCKTGEIFGLFGFPDPETDFSRLTKLLELKPVTSPDEAMDVFLAYSKLSYPEGQEVLLRDELDLMRGAIAYSREHSGSKTFQDFWHRCPVAIKRQILAPKVSLTKDEFQISYFTFQGGDVRKNSVVVSRGAQIMQKSSKTIFAWESK